MPRLRAFSLLPAVLVIALATATMPVLAHHSFAVFFDQEKTVTVKGKVTEFMFRNPHGVIRVEVTNPDGKKEEWRAETNSPSVLKRRGWSPRSLTVGEVITLEGWPARDGSNYMRMRKVTRENGEVVGKPFEFHED